MREHLPVVEEVLRPEWVEAAPEHWRRIGEDVSVQLDYEPGRFFRHRLGPPRDMLRAEAEAPPAIATTAGAPAETQPAGSGAIAPPSSQ